MVILQVVNTCFFMNQDCKPVLHFTFGMMLASVVAFLMHPLLWIQAGPYFDWSFLWVGVLYIFVYGAVGMFIRWKWWYLEETSNYRALYCQYNLGYRSSNLPLLASVY